MSVSAFEVLKHTCSFQTCHFNHVKNAVEQQQYGSLPTKLFFLSFLGRGRQNGLTSLSIRVQIEQQGSFTLKFIKTFSNFLSSSNTFFISTGKQKKKKSELRIVLVGKTGAGKSAAGNTFLGREAFTSELSSSSLTSQCERAEGVVGGRKVVVVDTPGLFDTDLTQEEVLGRITKCVSLSAPGPHAFLLVLKLGRFTQEEEETVSLFQSTFGDEAAKYSLVLFTHGDKLKKQSIEDFISKSDRLAELIQVCHGRYHVFNNRAEERQQINGLLEKIDRMTLENGGRHYTAKMFKRAEKASEKEKRRLSRELKVQERQRRRDLEAAVRKEMTFSTRGSMKYDTDSKNKCVLQ